MSERDGGPAFPNPVGEPWVGMSLRDSFAIAALAGFCSKEWPTIDAPGSWPETVAEASYDLADAMLKARGTEDE